MARQNNLPATSSRIFARKPSRVSRILSALLLGLSLAATLAGLGTAIYLERARDAAVAVPAAAEAGIAPPAPVTPAAVIVTSANDTHDPLAAAAAIPEPPPLRSAESPERQGGTSSPPGAPVTPTPAAATAAPLPPAAPPATTALAAPLIVAPTPADATTAATAASAPETQTALLEAPPAHETPAVVVPPPPEAAAPVGQYWVEYAVYASVRPAKRLQHALADQGIETVIVPTHTPGGRALLRVRSSQPLDHEAAKAASAEVRKTLKLSALVHRGSPAAGAAPAHDVAATGASHGYWVQFGAFPHRAQAARLQAQLARGGIETEVSAMPGTSGRTLYRVRSLTLPDRDSAMTVATRARQAGSSDSLVGQSVARTAPAIDPDRTENQPSIDGVPYRAAASLPFPAR